MNTRNISIKEFIKTHKLIMDGAMGTYFSVVNNQAASVSEFANLDNPSLIGTIHREYIRAGANFVRTNSFACNQGVLSVDRQIQKELLKASYTIAKEVADESSHPVYVACDIGPIPVTGMSEEEQILEEYQYIIDTFLEQKPEVFLFETFSDFYYIKQLLPLIKEKSPEVVIFTNFSLNKYGYTSSGISAAAILQEIEENPLIDGGGFNCGVGSGHMYQILKKLEFSTEKIIIAAPNAGYPEQYSNRMMFMDNEIYFGENMKKISQLGVDIIGGCCGTTPDFIRYINKHIELEANQRGYRVKRNVIKEDKKAKIKNEFYQLFETGKKVVAVELDPPFDANDAKIMECAYKLKQSGADIITIADSPMGRSRVDSILMALKIGKEIDIQVMPHICCRDKNLIAIRSGILGAYVNGIRNMLLVTGDPIPSEHRQSTTGVFDFNSIQLMSRVNDMNMEHFSEEPMYYGGALNYGRGNLDVIINRMKKKIEAGATYFLTQPIFSEEDVKRIAYIKERVDTKILCGIMPFVSYRNANFVKNEIMGIHVPDEVLNRYHPDMEKEEAEHVGAALANEIIEKLSPYADGYYFMLPFNRVSLMDKIVVL